MRCTPSLGQLRYNNRAAVRPMPARAQAELGVVMLTVQSGNLCIQ